MAVSAGAFWGGRRLKINVVLLHAELDFPYGVRVRYVAATQATQLTGTSASNVFWFTKPVRS